MFTDQEWGVFNEARNMLVNKKERTPLQERALQAMREAAEEYVDRKFPRHDPDLPKASSVFRREEESCGES